MEKNEGIKVYAEEGDTSATVQIRNVTKRFRSEFRTWCAKNDFTMNGALVALMKKAIEENIELDHDIAGWRC